MGGPRGLRVVSRPFAVPLVRGLALDLGGLVPVVLVDLGRGLGNRGEPGGHRGLRRVVRCRVVRFLGLDQHLEL